MHRLTPSLPTFSLAALIALAGCDLGEFEGDIQEPVVEPPPNVDPLLGCSTGCHGDVDSPAPPADTAGAVDPSLVSVGAHRAHLEVAPTWYRKGDCADCHQVPVGLNDPGHMDTPVPAELIFGAIPSSGGVTATWDGASCTVYCHGASMQGGTAIQPEWTANGSLNGQCDSCHGNPPPAPHPAGNDCGLCHATMQPGGNTFLDPQSHIDGKVDTAADNNAQGCDTCHGEGGVSAPPADLEGNTDPTIPSVGAHRAHLGTSDWHRELYCSQCHVVPPDVNAPGHMDDGDNVAEVIFDELNPQAAYDFNNATCSNLYCHGNGYSQVATASWTDNLFLACSGCHDDGGQGGENMSGKHKKHLDEDMRCADCHGAVVNQQMAVIAPDLHINGLHEIDMPNGQWDAATRTCTNVGCHGDYGW